MGDKFKGLIADDAIFYGVLVILVGVISFGLGRKSVVPDPVNSASDGVVFIESSMENPSQEGVIVVGSRSGTKYHLPDCPGVSQMKEENKVFFDSIELAEAAGYTPAANCPNLQ